MNLRELKEKVDATIESAVEIGDTPENIMVSIQIDRDHGSFWSSDIELHYDDDACVSGCVIAGDAYA